MMKHKPLTPIRGNRVNYAHVKSFDKFDNGLDRTLKSASLISLIGSIISFVIGFFLLRGYLYKYGLVWLAVGDLGPSLFMMSLVALSVFLLIFIFPAVFGSILVKLPNINGLTSIKTHRWKICLPVAVLGLVCLLCINSYAFSSILYPIFADAIVAAVASFIFISASSAPAFSPTGLKGEVQTRCHCCKQIVNKKSRLRVFLVAVWGHILMYLGFGLFTVIFSVFIFYGSSINESTKNHYSDFFTTGSIAAVIAMAWLGAFVASRPKSDPIINKIMGSVIVVIFSMIPMSLFPVSLAVVRFIGLGGLRYEITVKQDPSNPSDKPKMACYCIVAQDSYTLYAEKISYTELKWIPRWSQSINSIKKSDISKMTSEGNCNPRVINP